MIIATFRIAVEKLDLMEGHKRLTALLSALDPLLPKDGWYRVPHSAEENEDPWVPCSGEAFLRQTARDMGEDTGPWSEAVDGYAALITTSKNQAGWDAAGRTVIDFAPRRGVVRIETAAPKGLSDVVYSDARARFFRACSHLDVTYAFCDFTSPPRPNGARGDTYYGIDHRVFKHREFLGWMGVVRAKIDSGDVPEADEIIALPRNKGTMIVTVADAFNVHNPEHVKKAQHVEMRLADLDLLPVTDPRFL